MSGAQLLFVRVKSLKHTSEAKRQRWPKCSAQLPLLLFSTMAIMAIPVPVDVPAAQLVKRIGLQPPLVTFRSSRLNSTGEGPEITLYSLREAISFSWRVMIMV